MSFYTGTQSEVLYSMITPVTTTVSGTTQVLLSAAAAAPRAIIPAQFFGYQNTARTLFISARGTQTTSAATAPTWTMTLGFDTTPATAANTTTIAPVLTPTGSITGMGWQFDAWVVCTAVSGTATAFQINGRYELSTAATGTVVTAPQVNYFNNSFTTYSAEVQQFVELFGTWGTNTAGNSIILKQFLVLGMN